MRSYEWRDSYLNRARDAGVNIGDHNFKLAALSDGVIREELNQVFVQRFSLHMLLPPGELDPGPPCIFDDAENLCFNFVGRFELAEFLRCLTLYPVKSSYDRHSTGLSELDEKAVALDALQGADNVAAFDQVS